MKEKSIIKQLQVCNENEVEQLIQKNYAFVYSYLYRRCGNQELAKELTQETFYHFFRGIQNYEAKDKLLNYLYRTALHLYYDEIKKNRKYLYDYDIDQIKDHQETVQEGINRKVNQKAVQTLLTLLPPAHRDILILRFYQELKFKDIATIMHMSVSTIKSRYKATLKLMEHYWKEGESS